MKISKIKLTKEDLFSLPANERVFLVYAGHALNELNMLCRMIVFAMPIRRGEAERQFMVIQSLMLMRILAGKLHEMWVLFGKVYYKSKLSLTIKDQLSEEGTKSLKELNEYFSRELSAVTEIRHLHAFHYDVSQVDAGLANLQPKMSLDIYFDKNSANTIYGFADNIINSSVMASIDPESSKKAMETIMADTDQVARLFQSVLEAVMSVIVRQRLDDSFSKANVIEEDALSVPWSGVAFPTFVESPSPWSVTLFNGVVLTWGGQRVASPDYLRSLLSEESKEPLN